MVCRERKILFYRKSGRFYFIFLCFLFYTYYSVLLYILNLYNSMEILYIYRSRHWKTAAASAAASRDQEQRSQNISLCLRESHWLTRSVQQYVVHRTQNTERQFAVITFYHVIIHATLTKLTQIYCRLQYVSTYGDRCIVTVYSIPTSLYWPIYS